MVEGPAKVVRAVCPHNCHDTCGLLVHISNGRIVKVTGDPAHPTTRGFICAKVACYPERVYHQQRVLTPLKRVGEKGEGKFTPVTWDEALDTIATRFKEIIAAYGPEAIIPYSYSGTLGLLNNESMDRRFFHRLGATLLDRTICSAAGRTGYVSTVGAAVGLDPEDLIHSRLIILWGTNPVATNIHQVPFLKEAKQRGAKLVIIDPRVTPLTKMADEHFAPYPGTDAALALGIMHVMIAENRYDTAFVGKCTVGFDALAERVREYPPRRVAEITGIDADRIVDLARLYASAQPAVIRAGYGMQRHSNGGMMLRTIACLPALAGAYGKAGGGMLLSNSGCQVWNKTGLTRPDLLPNKPRTINMNRIGEALLSATPPIRAMYVYNSNPAASAPEQNKVIKGLARQDLFLVVHDLFCTDTAMYADILLPATTQFEHWDIHGSYWHLYIQVNQPAIPPLGQCKPNYEVFQLLAQRMGFTEPCFNDSPEELIRTALDTDHPYFHGITLERLLTEGPIRINTPTKPYIPFANGEFPTPSGKVELYSASLAKAGYDPLPVHVPLAETETASAAEAAARYPLVLLSPSAQHFLNSSLANLPSNIAAEKEPTLEIHPDDAKPRKINTGDWVTVKNDRGWCRLRAKVGTTTRPGVVVTTTVWWRKLSPDGQNVNTTVSDRLADMGGGATFYTNMVEIVKV